MTRLVSHPEEIKVVSRHDGQGAADIDKYLELGGYEAAKQVHVKPVASAHSAPARGHELGSAQPNQVRESRAAVPVALLPVAAARHLTNPHVRKPLAKVKDNTTQVVTDVPDDSKLMTEEPFGPIAPVVRFKSFDEVVARANALKFGLAAYAFTSSAQTATAIGDALESGMVGINSVMVSTPETPFGGIKDSGYGHESGLEGLEVYMHKKFISQG